MQQSEIENPYTTGVDIESTLHIDDTRKPKLTLRILDKLRKMRELKRLETIQQREFIHQIYGEPEADQQGF